MDCCNNLTIFDVNPFSSDSELHSPSLEEEFVELLYPKKQITHVPRLLLKFQEPKPVRVLEPVILPEIDM